MDNSRYFEEKFTEGYNTRTREINLNCLILIENRLYELTPKQMKKFYKIRGKGFNKDKHCEALEYIENNCKCINNNTKCFNY